MGGVSVGERNRDFEMRVEFFKMWQSAWDVQSSVVRREVEREREKTCTREFTKAITSRLARFAIKD